MNISGKTKNIIKSTVPPFLLGWISSIFRRLSLYRTNSRIIRSPDRIILVREILPQFSLLGAEILWVGCQRYTKTYPRILEMGGGRCWTLEINPVTACFGHPTRHVIGDLLQVDEFFPKDFFQAVLCNGVFGYGVNTSSEQVRALSNLSSTLREGGILLLGWNNDKTEDPVSSGVIEGYFTPAPFGRWGSRVQIPGTTHVYDFLQKNPLPNTTK